MPANNKNKTGTTGNNRKGSGNKNSKSNAITPGTVPTQGARGKAKDMDNKRRGDTETFKL